MTGNDTTKYKGYVIKAVTDTLQENPLRDWDTFGHYVCFHGRYELGTKEPFRDPDELAKFLKKEKPPVLKKLYLYDHSGITIASGDSNPFSCPWDSGMIGFMYATREEILKTFTQKRLTEGVKQKALKLLESQLQVYDSYLRGDVYCFEVLDKDNEVVDSCGGYYDYDHKTSGLLAAAQDAIDRLVSA